MYGQSGARTHGVQHGEGSQMLSNMDWFKKKLNLDQLDNIFIKRVIRTIKSSLNSCCNIEYRKGYYKLADGLLFPAFLFKDYNSFNFIYIELLLFADLLRI